MKLKRGDLILSSNKNNIFLYILSPSPIKHISIYFGNNLLNELINIKNSLLNNTLETIWLLNHKLYLKDKLLYEINNILHKNIINNYDYYFIEIDTKQFYIKTYNEFIFDKTEIYIYRLQLKYNYLFARYYLYFLGNDYSIFYDVGKRYCFESIMSLLSVMYTNFPLHYIYIFSKLNNKLHFNSLSITQNKYCKLLYIYKRK